MKLNDYLIKLFMEYVKDILKDKGEGTGIYEDTENTV
jgi:hypothetical protein